MKGKDIIRLYDIKDVRLEYPKLDTLFKWFKGQPLITKETWWDTTVLQEEISAGWFYGNKEKPDRETDIKDTQYFSDNDMYFIDGKLLHKGFIVILYNDGERYTFNSRCKDELNKYFNIIETKTIDRTTFNR
tara:strand:- start:2645 stop:3040 length:396 start_codon:yes stop_codon:yes gene_type:complete